MQSVYEKEDLWDIFRPDPANIPTTTLTSTSTAASGTTSAMLTALTAEEAQKAEHLRKRRSRALGITQALSNRKNTTLHSIDD